MERTTTGCGSRLRGNSYLMTAAMKRLTLICYEIGSAIVAHRCFPATLRRWIHENPSIHRMDLHFYRVIGRPRCSGETAKARPRRIREGFFSFYCAGKGLDVGYGGDLLHESAQGWDEENGDAQYLNGVRSEEYDYVYSSHTLEHMVNPRVALRNWWNAVKPGGYLILYIPHRDLYEKKTTLPSRWNADHKHYFLLDHDEGPCTIGLLPLLAKSINNYSVVYANVCSDGYAVSDPLLHSTGEYSIEVVVKKNEPPYHLV